MTTPIAPPERQDWAYVSQFGSEVFGVQVYRNGVLADADANAVVVTILSLDLTDPAAPPEPVTQRQADHPGTGQYSTTLTSLDTSVTGRFLIRFEYSVNGVADMYEWPVEIGASAPSYDQLPPKAKAIVESTYARFADLYDSPYGGPHLQIYLQTKFGRGRMADLLRIALQGVNAGSQPVGNYTYESFPYDEWSGLLERSLYIEVVKHLIRTYTEQPEVILGTAISRTDRRDYMDRWRSILDMEMPEYREMLGNYKMSQMFLGKPSVLVSGGAYGRWGPVAYPGGAGEAAARGYFVSRGYG